MIPKIVTKLALTRFDALMLVGGLVGGLAGSYLAVRAQEQKNNHVEIPVASPELHAAPQYTEAPAAADPTEPVQSTEHAHVSSEE